MIFKSVSRFLAYVSQMTQRVRPSPSGDPMGLNPSEILDLMLLDSPIGPFGTRAASTDTDAITAAVKMVPEIEWPDRHDMNGILAILNNHLLACFDSIWQLRPHTQAQAVACFKALFPLWIVQVLDHSSLIIYPGSIWFNGYVCPRQIRRHGWPFSPVQGQGRSSNLDFTSLSPSGRMWAAHMFTYHSHKGDRALEFDGFVACFC